MTKFPQREIKAQLNSPRDGTLLAPLVSMIGGKMFELKFLGTTASHKDDEVHVHLKIKHIDNDLGTEIKLRINTTLPSHDVSEILETKKPTNWYNQLIKEIESQFAELSRLAMS